MVLITLVAASSKCDDRTEVYNTHGSSNVNNFYFNIATYKKSNDPINNRGEFIAALSKEKINCTGQWCINGDWKCTNGNAECYHMEHIIPKGNIIPELNGCPLSSYNIRSNLVMSYGRWNIQLSNRYLGEKSLIYGDTIMTQAYQSVWNACKGTSGAIPYDLCLVGNNYGIIAGCVMILMVGISVMVIVYLARIKKISDQDD
jgi:hypothetical protein